jgi:biofilm protein TabA
MIYGQISVLDTYDFLLAQPAWKLAFAWLRTVTTKTPEGIHKLQGDDIYANVHGYQTLPASKCRYESHQRYIDLQYCISGGEFIDCHALTALSPDGAYASEKDLQFHLPYTKPAELASVRMIPGSFAIFFPSDAHAPKRNDGQNNSVFKLVIKVDRRLII